MYIVYNRSVFLLVCDTIRVCTISQVSVGQFIASETTPRILRYVTQVSNTRLLVIIIPVIAGGLLIVVACSMFIICCVVCYHRRKSKKNEQRWTNLLSQMELMELEMADECKRGELLNLAPVCVCVCERERERERDGTPTHPYMWE